MQIYRVGGSVRDEQLGLPVHDADWVVVGATPEQMVALGYRPVGKDFPVFLHPVSHDEYALARTERKTAPGYKGFAVHFSPDVTLEEDLSRRDLTINAMALANDNTLIDPYDGQADLAAKVLRHVSEAFTEDPVRILRLARFAARFAGFTVAPKTLGLMQQMVVQGEADALVAERVWQEMSRALMESAPARFFEVLTEAHALPRLLPQLQTLTLLLSALNRAAFHELPLAGRFGLLALACDGHNAASTTSIEESSPSPLSDGNAGTALAEALRAPNECRDVARLLVAQRRRLFDSPAAAQLHEAADLLDWIERFDGLRRPERLSLLMATANIWSDGLLTGLAQRVVQALARAQSINAGAIAKPLAREGPAAIAAGLRAARINAIETKAKSET